MDKKNAIRRGKRPSKILEDNFWDCSVCTYRNNAEAFKCSMCDVRKGTSTRKPRINPALVAAQASGTAPTSSKRPRSANSMKKKRRRPPRLNNVDRSSAQTRELIVSQSSSQNTNPKSQLLAAQATSNPQTMLDRKSWNPILRKLAYYYNCIVNFDWNLENVNMGLYLLGIILWMVFASTVLILFVLVFY